MAVRVSGINPDTTREVLEMFFESSKRSGGGDIKDLMYDRDKHTAIIWFEDDKVCQRCLDLNSTSDFYLDGSKLTIQRRSGLRTALSAAVQQSGHSKTIASGGQTCMLSGEVSLGDGSCIQKPGLTGTNTTPDTTETRRRKIHRSNGEKPTPRDGRASLKLEATDGVIASRAVLKRSDIAGYDFCTVELSNIPHDMTEHKLRLTVEAVFKGGGEEAIKEFNYHQAEHRAWVKLVSKEYSHELFLSSPLDVGGTPVHVVPLNTLLEDDPDYQGIAAIMVFNVPNGVLDQDIGLFFGNQNTSGGGKIEHIHRVVNNASVCITFVENQVAEMVLQKHHECPLQLEKQPLDIQRLKTPPPPPLCVGAKQIDRFILRSLPESIAGGDIKEFLSNKDCLVSKIRFSCKPGVALVTFDDFPDYDALLWRCGTKPLKGKMVSIQEIPLPTHIQVHGIWGLDPKMVQLYFDAEGDVVSSSVSPDETWIIYQFRDHDAVKRATGKSHTFEGKAIAVEVYYPDFGECPPCIDLTIPLHERHCTTSAVKTGGPVGRFIINCKEAIPFLNDGLRSHNAVVDTRHSSDEQLTLICNIAMGVSEINTWNDKSAICLETLVRGSFAAVTLKPEADAFQPVIKKAREYAKGDRMMLTTDGDTRTLTLAGWREEVVDAEATLHQECQDIEDDNSTEECIIPVQKDEALILNVSDYKAEILKRFPKLHVTIAEERVTLRGPRRHMGEAKLVMYERYTAKKRTRAEILTKDEINFLQLDKAAKYVTDELAAARVCAAWEITGEKQLTVITLKEADLDLAMACINRSYVRRKRGLVAAELAVLKTPNWKTWVASMQNKPGNILLFDVKFEELQWTCVRDIAQHIEAEVNKYLFEHVIHEEFVSVDAGVIDILEQNGDFQEAVKVDVEARVETGRAGLLLKGRRGDIEKVKHIIHQLVSAVHSTEHDLHNGHEIRYVMSSKGAVILEQLRTMYKCAITIVQEGTATMRQVQNEGKENDPAERVQSASNFQRTHNTSDLVTATGMIITQKIGCIEQENVDVIVNTTNCHLNLNAGGVSAAVCKAAGPSIQAECQQQAPKGIEVGDVITTSGGNLTAKYVIHGAALPWDGANGQSLQVLRHLMVSYLKGGMARGATSIAFPVIGTGNYRMPRDVVARAMYSEILTFSAQHPSTTIKDVRIVMHHLDQETIQIFGDYLKVIRTGQASSSSVGPPLSTTTRGLPASTNAKSTPSSGSRRTLKSNIPDQNVGCTCENQDGVLIINFGLVKCKVYQGDLTKERVDFIFNSTNEDLNLKKGAVSHAILTEGGKSIQEECERIGGTNRDGIAISGAGRLPCGGILHLATGHDSTSNLIRKGLQELEATGAQSVALPAIATGKMGASPARFAKDIWEAITQFLKKCHRGNIRDIRLVVYQKAMVRDLQKELKELLTNELMTKNRGAPAQQTPNVMLTLPEESSLSSTLRLGGDTMTLRVQSVSMRNIERAIEMLHTRLESAMRTDVIGGEENQEALSNLTDDLIAKIYAVGGKHFVDIEMYNEGREKRLKLSGLQDDVYPATTEVCKLLQKAEQNVKKARDIAIDMEKIHWEFSDDGERFETYSQEIGAIIEKAHRAKKAYAEWEEEDHKYRIDFKKMAEETVGGAGKSFPVRRRDISDAMSLPTTWTTHSDISSMKRVVLKAESEEYQEVQQQFAITNRTGKIEQIERIENPALYHQYDVHRTRMNADNPPGHQNERILYHSTSADTVEKINRNGLDRSFCRKNAAVQGKGVYFAREAKYSASEKYSPPNANGVKYMYQCKVLTGEFCKGARHLLKPPPKPGNSGALLYDTVVDDPANPGIFVVFNDTQAYPEYLIQFKA